MGVLACFGDHDFIAYQQVDVLSTVEMLTKEHPKQHGPWQCLGEKALHRPVTAAWARPAGEAQHRHTARHDQQRRHNPAQLAERRCRNIGSEALAKCYNVHRGFFVGGELRSWWTTTLLQRYDRSPFKLAYFGEGIVIYRPILSHTPLSLVLG